MHILWCPASANIIAFGKILKTKASVVCRCRTFLKLIRIEVLQVEFKFWMKKHVIRCNHFDIIFKDFFWLIFSSGKNLPLYGGAIGSSFLVPKECRILDISRMMCFLEKIMLTFLNLVNINRVSRVHGIVDLDGHFLMRGMEKLETCSLQRFCLHSKRAHWTWQKSLLSSRYPESC